MKKIILSLLILFGFTNMVTADETAVYDEANLLQENQIVELENKISSIENEYGIDIVLLKSMMRKGKVLKYMQRIIWMLYIMMVL